MDTDRGVETEGTSLYRFIHQMLILSRGWGARDRSWAFQELSSWLQLSFNEAQFTNDFFFLSCNRLYLTLCIKSYQPKIWKLSMLSSISFVALHFAYKAVIHLESIL